MRAYFIYFLRDPENPRKGYVGASENPKRRFKEHLRSLEVCYRGNWIRDLKKNGSCPELEILAQVPETTWSQDEIDYIAAFRALGFSLVNGTDGGDGSRRPGEKCYWFGKKLASAHCEKIRLAKLGKKLTPEHREALSNAQKGRKHSLETRAKQRAARLGKKRSPEERAAISAGKRRNKNIQ